MDSINQFDLCTVAEVVFETEILDHFLWDLTFVESKEMNLLALIETNFEDAKWFLLFLVYVIVNWF